MNWDTLVSEQAFAKELGRDDLRIVDARFVLMNQDPAAGFIGYQASHLPGAVAVEEVHLLQQEAPAGLEAAESAGGRGRTQRVDARRARQTQCARHVQRIADDDGAVQVVGLHEFGGFLQVLPGGA